MSPQVKKRVDWKSADGASEFPRRLHLEKATNQRYYCPVSFCDHEEFGSSRGCRKLFCPDTAENMSRQSMDGSYILIPSLILEKLRRTTRQYAQQ